MRISDWSSDVCSSDLLAPAGRGEHDAGQRCRDAEPARLYARPEDHGIPRHAWGTDPGRRKLAGARRSDVRDLPLWQGRRWSAVRRCRVARSEEHTSELQSLMRISYAVFYLIKKKPQLSIQS